MRPTERFLVGVGLGFPIALLPTLFDARLWTVWCAFVGIGALLFGVDALRALPARALHVEVDVPDAVPLGGGGDVEVTLVAHDRRAAAIDVRLEVGPPFEPIEDARVELPASGHGARRTARLPLRPTRRGTGSVDAVWLRWTGPFGLSRRVRRLEVDDEVAVTSDLQPVRSEALAFLDRHEHRAGVKSVRFLGDGSEFEALREYLPGFDRRTIDWKASARHRKLLCREHRAERNHRVVLAVDTGHLMIEPLEGVPKVDRAIRVGLAVSIVAAKTGDHVGLFAFDDRPRLFVPPEAGMDAAIRLQRRAAELEYSTAETNFTLALNELSLRVRRRAMIVVLTEFVDTVTAELMIESMARLARRHLVLFVTFSDVDLQAERDRRPSSLVDVNRSVVADDLLLERRVVRRRLERLGVQVLEAPWRRVSSALLNRYLEIKRRELV